MSNVIIALQQQQSIYTDGSVGKTYAKGQTIGVLNKNLNNGSLLVNNNEVVSADKVAINIGRSNPIVSKSETTVTQKSSIDRTNTIKKVIAISLIVACAYYLYKGKKGLGITLGLAGFIMAKRNF